LNGVEVVPAYFVRPVDATGRLPVVPYNHAHGGDYVLGKDELLVGRSALQRPPYAEVFKHMLWLSRGAVVSRYDVDLTTIWN
jgi:hypothetical protein